MNEQIIKVEQEITEQEILLENEPILMGGSGTRTITEDGHYDIKQYEYVDVDVVDGSINIATEGTHDVTHYETANVKTTSGEKNITENGVHDIRAYETANVNVQPALSIKTITENGTYNAVDDNADGYSSVSVNVPGVDLSTVKVLIGDYLDSTTQTVQYGVVDKYNRVLVS